MEQIDSSRTDDAAIEEQIQAKDLNAPRVTPAELADNITQIEYVKHTTSSGQILRWAVLIAKNGYAVVGNPSVAVSPENDNEEIGKQVAFENSKQQLWPLMGYALKSQLAAA